MSALVNRFAIGDKTTTLTSPQLAAGSQCLIFYYYTHGNVTLQVNYVVNGKTAKVLWSHSGDDEQTWKRVEVSIPSSNNEYKV